MRIWVRLSYGKRPLTIRVSVIGRVPTARSTASPAPPWTIGKGQRERAPGLTVTSVGHLFYFPALGWAAW